jgi:hypothetical protein
VQSCSGDYKADCASAQIEGAGEADRVSTTIVGSYQIGVSSSRQDEMRQILVTGSTLPQSILYTLALRDAAPLAG